MLGCVVAGFLISISTSTTSDASLPAVSAFFDVKLASTHRVQHFAFSFTHAHLCTLHCCIARARACCVAPDPYPCIPSSLYACPAHVCVSRDARVPICFILAIDVRCAHLCSCASRASCCMCVPRCDLIPSPGVLPVQSFISLLYPPSPVVTHLFACIFSTCLLHLLHARILGCS